MTFELGSVHDIRTDVDDTRKRDASGNLINRRALPSSEVSWVVPTKRPFTFDEAATLMRLEGEDHVDNVPTLSNDRKTNYLWMSI